MKIIRAYDLPLRFFHWTFVGLFIVSICTSKFIDDSSILFVVHVFSGLLLFSSVVLRIIWGLIGSKTSRFSSFVLSPAKLTKYFSSLRSNTTVKFIGHNPASSYSAILMFLFAIGMALTGILMSLNIDRYFYEEIHEILADGLLVIVLCHVLGVIVHGLRNNDRLLTSMIDGKKVSIDESTGIQNNSKVIAIIYVLLMLLAGLYLYQGYNADLAKLNILGQALELKVEEED